MRYGNPSGDLYGDSVTRVRAPLVTDRYGNAQRDWANADRTVLDGVSVQPATQQETTTAERDLVVTGWTLLSRPGSTPDIAATDRIEWRGLTLEVVGEVGEWGLLPHVEVALRRATG